jgi:hypothetical protein
MPTDDVEADPWSFSCSKGLEYDPLLTNVFLYELFQWTPCGSCDDATDLLGRRWELKKFSMVVHERGDIFYVVVVVTMVADAAAVAVAVIKSVDLIVIVDLVGSFHTKQEKFILLD